MMTSQKVKKKIEKIIGSINIIYGVLMTFIIKGIGACNSSNAIMKCKMTCAAEIVPVIIIITIGLIILSKMNDIIDFIKINLLAVLNSLLIIFIPLVIIGGCSNNKMFCRVVTFPMIYSLSMVYIFCVLPIIIYLIMLQKRKNDKN